MPALNAGDTLDHCRIDAVIAHTQMSALYKGTDLNSGRNWQSRPRTPKWNPTLFFSSGSGVKSRSVVNSTIPEL
ncbi:MAG TPA: hypothetical protein VN753_11185 [Terracidiphilus sp.]|nr:hypothetical protein [Terracidiphilus sp.]